MEKDEILKPNPKYGKLASKGVLEKTAVALKVRGFDVDVVTTGEAAKKKVLELIPAGAEVMNMTSATLSSLGLDQAINESGQYVSVREKLVAQKKPEPTQEMRGWGAAPDWVVGSVHGVTQDGSVLVASNTGSQLPAYAYGAANVIWVVGSQKIVPNLDEGVKRIYEYSYPLEDVRARQAYGRPSGVSKILIVNREIRPGRIHIILVGEKLGF